MKTFRSSVLAIAIAGAAGTAMADANSLNLLFPFDSSNPVGTGWTQSMARNDDGSSSLLDIGFTFCFYETDRTQLYINNNGNVTFNAPYAPYSPAGFPSAAVPAMIAPFWADVDTRNTSLGGIDTNLVWHRTFDTNGDSAPDVFVVTWDSVGFFNSSNSLRNTFQVAMAADPNHWGAGLNAAFSYGDMQWTTGSASGGIGGFGGFPATVGLNNGDGVRFSQLGRFDHEGVDYNEQMGGTSGVSFLDNRDFFFNACEGIVPNPGAIGLLGLGGLVTLRRRR
ncbi:MAG: nidogen-like domain-containing protein [Phycisphaerales bacterium]